MLENNNFKICRRLVRREFQFHKGRSILLMTAIALVSMLCTFSFALGFMTRDGMLHSYQVRYGSSSHIMYYGLNSAQASSVAGHAGVKKTVRLKAVGLLSDDMMEYRSVKLAAVNDDWAAATQSAPTYGRMPEADDEIALDELTLQSLAIPRKEGTEVELVWTPAGGAAKRVDTFRLCGWWNDAMGYTESCAWITPDAANKLCPDAPDQLTLGVTLYRPRDLDGQAQTLLDELGIGNVSYTTNLAYNSNRVKRAYQKAAPYHIINISVAMCGILMVYNIMRISTSQDVKFYGRLKSLGMSPRQISRLLFGQAAYLCLPAIPIGWLSGFALYAAVAPHVVIGTNGRNPALMFFSLDPFVCSGLLTWFSTLAACIFPARFVSRISPADAMKSVGVGKESPWNNGTGVENHKRKRGYHGCICRRRRGIVLFLVLSGIKENKRKSVLAAASMLLALTLLCSFWTQYVSTDEEKYLENIACSDYLIADASAASSFQRYNPASHSITPEFMKALSEHEAVTGTGTLRTMEVPMHAEWEERVPIVESFEGKNAEGVVRKEVMADSPDWVAGYEKFRETGDYIGIVSGVDGLALTVALAEGEYVDGVYDAECFETGDYVVASGASASSFLSTPPVGSQVEIGGRTFEIMASVSFKGSMVAGADSRAAAFNVSYYMPAWMFEELFPDSGIRNVLVDVDYNRQEIFEEFLEEMTRDSGIAVTMRSDHQWDFQNALFHNYLIPMFVGAVLFLIGILNFGNAMVTGVLIRKREIAVYESLGMTRVQIYRLFTGEGLLYGGMLAAFLVPSAAALTWIWSRWWAAYSASAWCVTWRYSLMPMWVTLPLLLAIALAVPLCCLRVVMKESITRRLQVVE